jgi:hypothetical protein
VKADLRGHAHLADLAKGLQGRCPVAGALELGGLLELQTRFLQLRRVLRERGRLAAQQGADDR